MTSGEQLRRLLRECGWKHTRCADLEAALYLVDESGDLTSELLGAMQAYACLYHVKKSANANYTYRRHQLIQDARNAAGGPSSDPGDPDQPFLPLC